MPESHPWKILLVDDEPSIRKVTAITLEDAGYRVQTAEDGRAGIEACRSFEPHILITDIRMPKMDGIALLEAVKKEFPDTEVVVVNAYGEIDVGPSGPCSSMPRISLPSRSTMTPCRLQLTGPSNDISTEKSLPTTPAFWKKDGTRPRVNSWRLFNLKTD